MRDKGKILEEHFDSISPGSVFWITVKPENRVQVSIIGIHEILPIESHMLLRSPSPDWALDRTVAMSMVLHSYRKSYTTNKPNYRTGRRHRD